MKLTKTIYWIATLSLCAVFLYSAQMYFFNTEMVKGYFTKLSYPEYIVIPLAIAKVLGVIVILWRKNSWLTEWAYAGFFFDLVLATAAHLREEPGISMSAYFIPVLLISYFLGKQARPIHE